MPYGPHMAQKEVSSKQTKANLKENSDLKPNSMLEIDAPNDPQLQQILQGL